MRDGLAEQPSQVSCSGAEEVRMRLHPRPVARRTHKGRQCNGLIILRQFWPRPYPRLWRRRPVDERVTQQQRQEVCEIGAHHVQT